ncbi:MAG: hypothetical protein KatS3mg076_1465 [Candidatus Binatia bacterium]|nr:MAG: hypothetical protein KatS3mg076_1465 [Candidatus Binatia bacterium]
MRKRTPWAEAAGTVIVVLVAGCAVPKPGTQWKPYLERLKFPPRTSHVQKDDARAGTKTADKTPNLRTVEFDDEHPTVDAFVEQFSTRSRRSFGYALERSGRFVPEMMAILEEEGLPPELAYLPLIESGYRTNARSPAGAVGPWQFVRSTGERYGLRIDWYVDERRDPVKSTRAAARYLADLHEMFGDWNLSIAAYNTGEFNVARVVDRGTKDFWEMAEKGYLHPETRSFVPQFLAALKIAREPEAHGFAPPELRPLEYDTVRVDRSVSLRKIAEMTGSSLAEIQSLNPALLRGVTPPGGYTIRVPSGTGDRFQIAYAREKERSGRLAAAVPPPGTYRIRPGDTPASIATRFGVSVEALMRANDWSDPRAIRAGALARIPKEAAALTAASSAPGSARASAQRTTYRIRPGDTPETIARRFGVAVEALMAANGWKDPRKIRAGDLATIPLPGDASPDYRLAAREREQEKRLN